MAANVGVDTDRDIEWVETSNSLELLAEGKIDAFLATPPDPQIARDRKIGHPILITAIDRPWSQYFCCLIYGNADFVRQYPVATKRALRALLNLSTSASPILRRQLGVRSRRVSPAATTTRCAPS